MQPGDFVEYSGSDGRRRAPAETPSNDFSLQTAFVGGALRLGQLGCRDDSVDD